MSAIIMGVVTNGVVIPTMPLPEGACVEIHLPVDRPESPSAAVRITPGALRKMPRKERQAILAAAAVLAEEDYRDNKDLTGFAAFSEEIDDDSHEG